MKDRETTLGTAVLNIVNKTRVFLNLKPSGQADVRFDQNQQSLRPDQPLSEFSRTEIQNMIDELKIQ